MIIKHILTSIVVSRRPERPLSSGIQDNWNRKLNGSTQGSLDRELDGSTLGGFGSGVGWLDSWGFAPSPDLGKGRAMTGEMETAAAKMNATERLI